MSSPQTAGEVLDRTYLEIRTRILDIAASLDRIERANHAEAIKDDERLDQIRAAIGILNGPGFDRAEKVQMVFSDDYVPGWNKSSA